MATERSSAKATPSGMSLPNIPWLQTTSHDTAIDQVLDDEKQTIEDQDAKQQNVLLNVSGISRPQKKDVPDSKTNVDGEGDDGTANDDQNDCLSKHQNNSTFPETGLSDTRSKQPQDDNIFKNHTNDEEEIKGGNQSFKSLNFVGSEDKDAENAKKETDTVVVKEHPSESKKEVVDLVRADDDIKTKSDSDSQDDAERHLETSVNDETEAVGNVSSGIENKCTILPKLKEGNCKDYDVIEDKKELGSPEKHATELASSEVDSSSSCQPSMELNNLKDSAGGSSKNYFENSMSALLELQKEATRIDSMVDESPFRKPSGDIKKHGNLNKEDVDKLSENKDSEDQVTTSKTSVDQMRNSEETTSGFKNPSVEAKVKRQIIHEKASVGNMELVESQEIILVGASDSLECLSESSVNKDEQTTLMATEETKSLHSNEYLEHDLESINLGKMSGVLEKPSTSDIKSEVKMEISNENMVVSIALTDIDDNDMLPLSTLVKEQQGRSTRGRKRGKPTRKIPGSNSTIVPKELVIRLEKMNFRDHKMVTKKSSGNSSGFANLPDVVQDKKEVTDFESKIKKQSSEKPPELKINIEPDKSDTQTFALSKIVPIYNNEGVLSEKRTQEEIDSVKTRERKEERIESNIPTADQQVTETAVKKLLTDANINVPDSTEVQVTSANTSLSGKLLKKDKETEQTRSNTSTENNPLEEDGLQLLAKSAERGDLSGPDKTIPSNYDLGDCSKIEATFSESSKEEASKTIGVAEGIVQISKDDPLEDSVKVVKFQKSVSGEKQVKKKLVKKVSLTKLSNLSNNVKYFKRLYFCEVCSLSFNCVRRYWNHKNLLHYNHEFECVLCDKKFTKTSALVHHNKFRHTESSENGDIENGNPLFYCEACGEGFRNIQRKISHVQNEHKDGYIFCSLCDHASPNVDDFVFHAKEHTRFKNTLFSCKVCGQNMFFLHMFINHLYGHENVASPKKFYCKICHLKVQGFKGFAFHMQSHVVNMPKYYCFLCEKIFLSNKKLESHIKYQHQKHYSEHQKFMQLNGDISAGKGCYLCCKVVPKTRLKLHLKTHKHFWLLSKRKQLVTCKYCLKEVFKITFKKHLAKHKKEAKNKVKEHKKEKAADKKIILKELYIKLTRIEKVFHAPKVKPAVKIIDLTSDTPVKPKQTRPVEGGPKSDDVFKKPAIPPLKAKPNKPEVQKADVSKLGNYKIPKKSESSVNRKVRQFDLTGTREAFKHIDSILSTTSDKSTSEVKKIDVSTNKTDIAKSSQIAADNKDKDVTKQSRFSPIKSITTTGSPVNKKPASPWLPGNVTLSHPRGPSPSGFQGTGIRPGMSPPMGGPRPPFYPPVGPGPGPNQFFNPRPMGPTIGPPGVDGPPGVHMNQGFGGPFPPNNAPRFNPTAQAPMNQRMPMYQQNMEQGLGQEQFFNHPAFLNQFQQVHGMGDGFQGQQVPYVDPNQFGYNEQNMAMYQQYYQGDYNAQYMAQWQDQQMRVKGSESMVSTNFVVPPLPPPNVVSQPVLSTQCSGCEKKFPNAKVVGVHEIFCVKLVDKLSKMQQHVCSVCLEKFPNLAVIKQHLFLSHAQIFKEFNLITGKTNKNVKNECTTCKQTFTSKENLQVHEKTHEFLLSLKADLAKVQASATIVGKPITGAKTSTSTLVKDTAAKQSRFDALSKSTISTAIKSPPGKQSRFDTSSKMPTSTIVKGTPAKQGRYDISTKTSGSTAERDRLAKQSRFNTETKTPPSTTRRDVHIKKNRFDILPVSSRDKGAESKDFSTSKAGTSRGLTMSDKNTRQQEPKSSTKYDRFDKPIYKDFKSDSREMQEKSSHILIQQKLNESLKKTQEIEKARNVAQTKILETIKSPTFKKNLEQQKKKLKINLLYFQKQKLEQEKQVKNLEMLKAEQELQRIQEELLNSQKTGDVDTIDLTDTDFSQSSRRGRPRSRSPIKRKQPQHSFKDDYGRRTDLRRSRSRSREGRSPDNRGRRLNSPLRERGRSRDRGWNLDRKSPTQKTLSREESRITLRRSRSRSRDRRRRSPSPKIGRRRSRSISPIAQRRRSRSNSVERLTSKSRDKSSEQSGPRFSERIATVSSTKFVQEPGAYRCQKCATLFSNYRDFIVHKDVHEDSDEEEENYLTLLDPPPPPMITDSLKSKSVSKPAYDPFQKDNDSSDDEHLNKDYYKASTSQKRRGENVTSLGSGPSFLQRQAASQETSSVAQYLRNQSNTSSSKTRFSSPITSSTSLNLMMTAYAHLQQKQKYVARIKCLVCGQEFPNQEYLDYHACSGPF